MLIYHPAFDAYHCAFRAVVITDAIAELELAKLRIIDFYLCFPAEVANIQLPQDHMQIRKVARAASNNYRGPVNAARTFKEMEPIQVAAARMLAASGVLDPHHLEDGVVSRTRLQTPQRLAALKSADTLPNTPGASVREYILNKLSQIPLAGSGGLKQRTGLMEFRYDAA